MRVGAPVEHGGLSLNPLFRSNRPLAIVDVGVYVALMGRELFPDIGSKMGR